MRKTSISLILTMGIMILTAACSDATLVQNSISENLPTVLNISPTGSSYEVIMSFASQWKAEAFGDWINVSPRSGTKGTYIITISSSVNRTRSSRSGTVLITSEEESREIPIVQDFPYLKMNILDSGYAPVVLRDSVNFKWNETNESGFRPYNVKIESNVDWRISLTNGYGYENFILSEQSGSGSKDVTFYAKSNNLDKLPFESVLSVMAYMPDNSIIGEGVDSYSVNLFQKNLRFLLNDSTDDITINIDELNQVVENGTVIIDSELPWEIASSPMWVNHDISSGSAGETTIHVNADGVNPTLFSRAGDLVLRSSGGAERTLHIYQKPYVFTVKEDRLAFNNKDEQQLAIHLETTGTWQVVDIPDWLNVTNLTGEGTGTIYVSCADQNLNLTDNDGALRIESTMNSIFVLLPIRQDRFVFDLEPAAELSSIPTFSTMDYKLGVKSSGSWSISSDTDWVRISDASGTGTMDLNVGAFSVNPDMDNDRSAVITLVSETHKERGISLTKKIDIRQTKFLFTIDTPSTTVPAYTQTKKFTLNIVCSQNWRILECPSWLIPDSYSGQFNTNLNFIIQTNTDKSLQRRGKIKVLSEYNNKTLETVEIVQDRFVFSVSSNSFSNIPPIEAPQQSISISCTDEVPWEISGLGSWVSVSANRGTGDSQIMFTPSNNLTTAPRNTSCIVTNKVSNEQLTINLNQDPFVFSVLGGSSYNLNELEEVTETYQIRCSSSWSINTGGASWINFSRTSGTGDQTVVMSIPKNTNLTERRATFTIYSNMQHNTSNELSFPVSVNQSAFKFDSTPVSQTFSPLSNGASFSFNVVCSGKWHAESVPSWVTVTPSSGGGNAYVTVTPENNTNLSSRTSDIQFVSDDNFTHRKIVTVEQESFVFSVDKTSVNIPANGDVVQLALSSTADWTILSNQTWARPSLSSGTSSASINITVDKNTTKNDRSATLTITSRYNHRLSVIINQGK